MQYSVIVAGGSGLVGQNLLKLLDDSEEIVKIHALSRKKTDIESKKIIIHQNSKLKIPQAVMEEPILPHYGFICLGTTIKKAGSKSALEKIDLDLVCLVAEEMKAVGVKYLAVVSAVGASAKSIFHYLRCKGRMEERIEKMGFEKLYFMHPGSLIGKRNEPRLGEKMTISLISPFKSLMRGRLAKYIPIEADSVARAMWHCLARDSDMGIHKINSIEMRKLLASS